MVGEAQSNGRARGAGRERILAAATRLFASRGFGGTSLDAIAAAAELRKASVLYHYPSKEALREAVLDQLLSHWSEVLPGLLRAATAGERQFENVTGAAVEFFTADPDRARLLVREVLDRPDDMKRRLQSHVQPWLVILSDYIRRGQAQGHIQRDVDPEAYVAQIITLVVAGIATAETLDLRLPRGARGGPRRARTRQVAELLRVARASLFTPAAADGRRKEV